MVFRSEPQARRQFGCTRNPGSTLLVLAVAMGMVSSSIAQAQTAGVAPEFVPGELIVKLKGRANSVESQAAVGRMVTARSMSIKASYAGLNMHHVQIRSGADLKASLQELQADPAVEFAEPNYIVRRQSVGMEGEPVPMAVARANAGGSARVLASVAVQGEVTTFSQTAPPIQAQQAWQVASTGMAPVVVAVIDTGVDYNHEVFTEAGAIWQNQAECGGGNNGVDDDRNGFIDDCRGWNFVSNSNDPMDDDGHGTHVAGIVFGTTQDILAASLATSKVKIMPLKFLDANGAGTTADAIKAIYYAVNNGARILNNSWGGGGASQALFDAIKYSYDRKAIFLAAAGNSRQDNDITPTYPANYDVPALVSVAATTDADGFASSFSNFGRNKVHVGSPGSSVYSTLPGNLYGRSSGTSMATPFVAGVAAMMLYEKPEMFGYQLKQLIQSSAQRINSLSNRTSTQARINVYTAVLAAKSASVDNSQPAATQSASLASEAPEMQGGCGLVKGLDMPASPWQTGMVLLALVAPLAFALWMRNRDPRSRRRYERYKINSEVRLHVGGRELVGNVSSISLGGVQVNTEALLERGGVVSMSIRSPDGKNEINVEGQVVWSEEQKRYGVAFANAGDSQLSQITQWTRSLMKAG